MKNKKRVLGQALKDLKNYIELEKVSGINDFYVEEKVFNTKAGDRLKMLKVLKGEVLKCNNCSLRENCRNVVFGSGNPCAELVFVGEAPGYEEDIQGLPFVGRAGQLLTKIIEAIGYKRKDVFICNVLKCRPPENRSPLPSEIFACQEHLIKQLNIIKPKLICALGKFAAQTLLKTETPISALRGKFYDYHGIKLIPTFHPAYLLRNPQDKRLVWEDMKKAKKYLEGSHSERT